MRQTLTALAIASMFVGSSVANAEMIMVDFPSDDSTVVASLGTIDSDEFGHFWSVSRGDSITEEFTGTGLASINQLDLNFDVTRNVLDTTVMWDVLVNGILVGDWSWSETDGIGTVNESYNFASIVGNGTYEIRMEVTNEVPVLAGSIAIGYPGTAKLSNAVVPTPSSFALLGMGAVSLLGFRRRRKAEVTA